MTCKVQYMSTHIWRLLVCLFISQFLTVREFIFFKWDPTAPLFTESSTRETVIPAGSRTPQSSTGRGRGVSAHLLPFYRLVCFFAMKAFAFPCNKSRESMVNLGSKGQLQVPRGSFCPMSIPFPLRSHPFSFLDLPAFKYCRDLNPGATLQPLCNTTSPSTVWTINMEVGMKE